MICVPESPSSFPDKHCFCRHKSYGSIFKFDETKKDAERETQRGVPNGSLANATSSTSKHSIPSEDKNVNTPDENSKKSYSSPDTDVLLPSVDSPSVSESITVLENAESESGGRLYNYKAMEADEKE